MFLVVTEVLELEIHEVALIVEDVLGLAQDLGLVVDDHLQEVGSGEGEVPLEGVQLKVLLLYLLVLIELAVSQQVGRGVEANDSGVEDGDREYR